MYYKRDAFAQAAIDCGFRMVLCGALAAGDDWTVGEMDTIKFNNLHPLISYIPGIHAEYTANLDLLMFMKMLLDEYKMPFFTHNSETKREVEECIERHGLTPTQLFEENGLFEHGGGGFHCVWLDETDMDIFARRGLYAVTCPASNAKLASGIAPVARLLERGANVGIGTDGPSSNNDLDMWDEMRTGSFLQKVATGDPCVLPAYEVLRMATTRAADAIGMKGEIGVLAEGARADLIVLNLDKPHLTPCHDLVANLVYCAKPSDVETVMVDGRIVVRQGALANGDFGAIRREVERRLGVLQRRGE